MTDDPSTWDAPDEPQLVVGESYTREQLDDMFPGAVFVGWPEDDD